MNNINMNTQRQRLNQLVDQISSQEAQLNRLKALRESAKRQTAINTELNNQLSNVNKSIDEKDDELRQALNRVDNLNRKVNRRTSKEVKKKFVAKDPGTENRNLINNGRRVSFDPLALLLDAALEGELKLVKQTSKQVTDLDASHDECVTALHNATVAGHFEVAKYLIEAGCDINVQDSDGWTPLHCAASCNNLPLVVLLIENGASIYATTSSDDSTPAMKCEQSEEGFKDCYKYLISVQNNLGVINNARVYALYDYKAKKEDELSFKVNDEFRILRRDDRNGEERWWAQQIVYSGNEQAVELKEGYIPRNLIGLHPRRESFLKTRITSRKFKISLLLDAALEGDLDLVKKASQQVADLNVSHDDCVTAIHNAAVAGHYEVAKYLVEAGCDINIQNSDGWTPLHCAASRNNLSLVVLLVENGASIYATTPSDNSTPAMKCGQSDDGFKDCYNYLISVQKNLGIVNNGRVYALYDYEAQEGDELSFSMNDELRVIRRDDSDEQDWWWAQKRVHPSIDTVVELKEGYIPANLVGLHPRCGAFLESRNNKKCNNGRKIQS